MIHLWAKSLRYPCRLQDPRPFTAGGGIRCGPLVGKVPTSALPSRGSPPFQSGGGKVRGGPLVGKVARSLCRLADPHRCRAWGKIRTCPVVGKGAMSPLPSRGSQSLQRGGQNQKWPTGGQGGYVTPAVLEIPAAERGAELEVAHFWAKWLRHPCCLRETTASERVAKSEVAHLLT